MRTNQQVKDLHLPHCEWRDFLKFTPTAEMPFLPTKDVETLDEYFRHFARIGPCIKCDSILGAQDHLEAFLGIGTFKFGIFHGEGFCRKCSWPARAIHYNIGPIKELEMILQYHPDVVSWDEDV